VVGTITEQIVFRAHTEIAMPGKFPGRQRGTFIGAGRIGMRYGCA
jgi:hypothetical protein